MTGKNLCIIPARGGSKRIPRKNLYPFEGIPMLAHAIRIARTAGCFHEVLVSTDCPEIAAVARRFGASVPFMRSTEASDDYASTFEVIDEVLDRLEVNGQAWKIGACVYPTAVLARSHDLTQAVHDIDMCEAEAIFPVTRYDYPIWRSLLLKADGVPFYAFPEHANSRSQDLVPAYHDAGQWYAFDISALRAKGSLILDRTRAVILQPEHVQDIDTLSDLRMAKLKFRARCESSKIGNIREKPWVLIRTDATTETGSGHVMRCLALAAAFAERNQDVMFVSRTCVTELRHELENRGYESRLLEIPKLATDSVGGALADAAATLALISEESMPPAWVVVDHYGLDSTWEAAIRSSGSPLLVLDDLADRPHACDVLLDQNMIESNHARYASLVPEGAILLLGGEYSLLRPEFAQALLNRELLLRENSANDIVLFMGATDISNATLPLAMELSGHFGAEKVVVIVGVLNASCEDILAWCHKNRVRSIVGLDDISALLERCRLFVGACGMTAVEAQGLGIPSVLVPLSPIQKEVAEWFASRQRAILLDLNLCTVSSAVATAVSLALALPKDWPSDRPISVFGAKHVVDTVMEISHE